MFMVMDDSLGWCLYMDHVHTQAKDLIHSLAACGPMGRQPANSHLVWAARGRGGGNTPHSRVAYTVRVTLSPG
jgi:hypothetical protein